MPPVSTVVVPVHIVVVPDIDAMGFELMVTPIVLGVPVCPQSFEGVTVTLPLEVPKSTVIDAFPCPETDAPDGTVHVYVSAPDTGLIEYVAVVPEQTAVGPVIGPAALGGGVTITWTYTGMDQPQQKSRTDSFT